MENKTSNPDSMATSNTPGHISTHYYGSEHTARAQALAMTRQGYRAVAVTDTGDQAACTMPGCACGGVAEGMRWFVVAVR
jgi:hypothetical protein